MVGFDCADLRFGNRAVAAYFFSVKIAENDRDFRKREAERNSRIQEELNLALIEAQMQIDSTSMRKKINIDLLIRAKDRL